MSADLKSKFVEEAKCRETCNICGDWPCAKAKAWSRRATPSSADSVTSGAIAYGQQAKPQIGETWYIRYPGGKTLATVIIKDTTECTVEIVDAMRPYSSASRYQRSDLQFVECVKGGTSEVTRKQNGAD